MSRSKVRAAAHEAIARGEPLAWFERVYEEAAGATDAVPWADLVPNPSLVEWFERAELRAKRALVVGCGLGDDAEWLAARGLTVTAFDVAPKAIAWCRERFPASAVEYRVADLFAPPAEWTRAFDFVFEAYTLQSLPQAIRATATSMVPRFVAPGGTLLVVARGADAPVAFDQGPPWALAKSEIELAAIDGDRRLSLASWEDFVDGEGQRRFRATFHA
ncbi:MAG: class I SAM-dependent methyltransferase [Deltaproteobacteria bacterium]|nr:class I SAM-dependent methyltransferase [Deltaproteobacteria bacterium]